MIHYIENGVVYSNLKDPMKDGYICDVGVDNQWIKQKIAESFGFRAREIANRGVVEIEVNSRNTILIYNHDGQHYVIRKRIELKDGKYREKKIENVPDSLIESMSRFISEYGENAFRAAVRYGAFNECWKSYTEATGELKTTKNFDIIKKAMDDA